MSRIFDSFKRAPSQLLDVKFEALSATGEPEPPHPNRGVTSVPSRTVIPLPEQSDAYRVLDVQVPALAPLFPYDGTNPYASEQYRILRTKLTQHARQPRSVVISSAAAADGKSTTAVNLSAAFALKADAKVLLIDGDFRRATIATQLGLPEGPGLANVLNGECKLTDAIVRAAQISNLYVLTAGNAEVNPSELLDSPAWNALNEECRETFRYVFYDSPPIAMVADFDLIQATCDGILLVVRQDHTRRAQLFETIKRIPKERLLGVVVNSAKQWPFHGRSHYGSYTYYGRPVART